MGTGGPPPRDYRIEDYTRTVCPACFADRPRRSDEPGVFVDGLLVSHHDRVWMRRFCPDHGESESLYEEDLELWRTRQSWRVPTLRVTPDRADNRAGFPDGYRHGLPASHAQHTCILLLNVTRRCNLSCPTCYADARPPGEPAPADERPSVNEILHTVRTMLDREHGKLGVLMLSGGEPTVRADLPELLPRLFEQNITRIMLNTNGRRLARDDALLALLAEYRSRVEVYLQFDGLEQAASTALRGEDLVAEKLLALRRLDDAGVGSTLVVTVARGVNDRGLGRLLRLGLDTPHCQGLALQPMFGSGRHTPFDPLDRVTPTGLLRSLAEQTDGLVAADDFIPLPCSHPDCCDLSYLLRGADEQWRSLPKLVGRDELRRWLGLIGNTITFDELREPAVELLRSGALQRVFSEQLRAGAAELTGDLCTLCGAVPGLLERLGGLWARVSGPAALERLAERTFRLTVKMFMDAHTFHEHRLRQCCVHTGTFEADPRRYSFCWRWLFADSVDFPEVA